MKKIKSMAKRLSERVNAFCSLIAFTPFLTCAATAPILNLIVEALSRRSGVESLRHMISEPWVFICNSLIILLTLTLSLFFSRQFFVMTFLSGAWLLLGTANFVVLSFRTTPLAAVDFKIMDAAVKVVKYYLDIGDIALIVLGFGLLAVLAAFIWKKSRRIKPDFIKAFVSLASVALFTFTAMSIGINTEALQTQFTNLVDAYEDYGFAYCFSYGLIDQGINKPDGYSEEAVRAVLDEAGDNSVSAESAPDIIAVQLESFCDIRGLTGIELSADPSPNFTALKANGMSGKLTVPTVGAGTVNTEFEAISGMSLAFFGPGEYPYKTILKTKVCDSLCFQLGKLGYTSSAIHNHAGLFYQRSEVYPMLGFDSFTSSEYMTGLTYNARGWENDEIMTGEILSALDATAGQDFIYAVTVQGHGSYPTEPDGTAREIKVLNAGSEQEKNELEYYAEQISQTDEFIGKLIAALEERGKPCIVVFFGDHLPSIDAIEQNLTDSTLYQTEYAVWSNLEYDASDEDLTSYRLMAALLSRFGFGFERVLALDAEDGGSEEMHMLEYDMLYGEGYAYEGTSAPEKTDMSFGHGNTKITGTYSVGDALYVKGTGFTTSNKILLNGKFLKTVYVSSELLCAEDASPKDGDAVSVCFAGDDEVLIGPEVCFDKPFAHSYAGLRRARVLITE